jgi:hypothetical protein
MRNRQVYWLVVSAAWGTSHLFGAKHSAKVDDNDWGFGQILPIFLLIGPIVTVIEAITPESQWEKVTGRIIPSDGTYYTPISPPLPVD